MTKKYIFLLFLLNCTQLFAQEPKSDTILINSSGHTKIVFSNNISLFLINDDLQSYNVTNKDNQLDITKVSANPMNPDAITVCSGLGDRQTCNDFTVVYKPVKNEGKALYDYSKIDNDNTSGSATSTGAATEPHDAFIDNDGNLHLGKAVIGKNEFDNAVKKLLDNFNRYISILYNHKNKTMAELDNTTKFCLALFVEQARVQVSTASSQVKKTLKVKDYLDKIRISKFDSVEITSHNLVYISHLHAQVDGSYEGVVTQELSFVGYNTEHKATYSDKTVKSYIVKFIPYDLFENGKNIRKWLMKLSDVSVISTSRQ